MHSLQCSRLLNCCLNDQDVSTMGLPVMTMEQMSMLSHLHFMSRVGGRNRLRSRLREISRKKKPAARAEEPQAAAD